MIPTFDPPNLSDATELVYDTETNGVDWLKNHVVGYVLTWGPRPNETVYWPTRHKTGNNLDHDQVTRYIQDLAKRKEIMWTGHNMKFDMHMSKNEGIDFAGTVNCTQTNAALLDENQGKYSLDNCARLAGVTEKKGDALYQYLASRFGGEPTGKQMEHFWKLSADDDMVHEYAAGDGTSTWELWNWQRKQIFDTTITPSLDRIWSLECRVLKTLLRMERHGVRIDEEQYEWLCKHVNDLIENARRDLPIKSVNVRSTPQIGKMMLDHGNIDLDEWPKTATGKPQFNVETLESHPIGQSILTVRKLNNLRDSFLNGQIKNFLHNGRIHTNFNQLKMDDYGVITGRLSSNSPNLQQVPKRDKVLAPLFRSIFVPDPGYYWSANDYAQQEYVVFAHYSRSKMLTEGYNFDPPIDMHQNVADMMGVERDPTAKRLNLGKLYGMGVNKLAKSLGVTRKEAQRLSTLWDTQVPEAKAFLKKAEKKAKGRGFVHTPMGRRRNLNYGIAHNAGNAVIQMCSADITKLKMVEVDEYFQSKGDECQLMLQIHDELDWQVPFNGAEMDQEAQRIMTSFTEEDEINLKVRLRVDHDEGDNWAISTFGEECRDKIQRTGI